MDRCSSGPGEHANSTVQPVPDLPALRDLSENRPEREQSAEVLSDLLTPVPEVTTGTGATANFATNLVRRSGSAIHRELSQRSTGHSRIPWPPAITICAGWNDCADSGLCSGKSHGERCVPASFPDCDAKALGMLQTCGPRTTAVSGANASQQVSTTGRVIMRTCGVVLSMALGFLATTVSAGPTVTCYRYEFPPKGQQGPANRICYELKLLEIGRAHV